MNIFSAYKSPSINGSLPAVPGIPEMPRHWQGLPITWTKQVLPPMVFIDQIEVQVENCFEIDTLLIYGMRYDLKYALVNNMPLADGYFIEYLIQEYSKDGKFQTYRLSQQSSACFSDTEEKNDYIVARQLDDPSQFTLAGLPNWTESRPMWPTLYGEPMIFLGEVSLTKNEITESHLTWNKALFLFGGRARNGLHYKILVQDILHQNLSDHYKSEEKL